MAGVHNSFWIQCYKKHTKLKICSWKSWSRSLNSKVDICYWKPAVAVIKLYSSVGFLRWVSRMELFCISGRSHSHFFGLNVLLLYSPSCLVNVRTFFVRTAHFSVLQASWYELAGVGGGFSCPNPQIVLKHFEIVFKHFEIVGKVSTARNGFWAISLAPSRKRNWAGKVRRSWQNSR